MRNNVPSITHHANVRLRYGTVLALAFFSTTIALAQTAVPGLGFGASHYQLQLQAVDSYRLAPGYRQPTAAIPLDHLPYSEQVASAARASNLDPALVHALIAVESGHRQDAVSPKGAIGLMQLLPGTALRYGVRLPGKSPDDNLRAGTFYLRDLLTMFENRLDLALAAYNAGEGAVQKYGNRIPPYRETRRYVPAVMEKYEEWKALMPARPQSVVYLPGTRLDEKLLGEFRYRRD